MDGCPPLTHSALRSWAPHSEHTTVFGHTVSQSGLQCHGSLLGLLQSPHSVSTCTHLQHSQLLGHGHHGGISVADGGMPLHLLSCVSRPYARGEYVSSKDPNSSLLRSVWLLQAHLLIPFPCAPDMVPNPSHLELMTFFLKAMATYRRRC